MTAKEYLNIKGICEDTIYDNADRPHDLECLLNDFLEHQQINLSLGNVINCNCDSATFELDDGTECCCNCERPKI